MLTKRQIEILLNFFSNLDAPVSLQVFTDQFHLSLRSIQTDIAEIKKPLKNMVYISKITKKFVFVCLIIKLLIYLCNYKIITLINEDNLNISYIISRLLDSNDYLKMQIADEI